MSKHRNRHGRSKANRGTCSTNDRLHAYGDYDNRRARCDLDPWVVVGTPVVWRDDATIHGIVTQFSWVPRFSGQYRTITVTYDDLFGGEAYTILIVREFYSRFQQASEA